MLIKNESVKNCGRDIGNGGLLLKPTQIFLVMSHSNSLPMQENQVKFSHEGVTSVDLKVEDYF